MNPPRLQRAASEARDEPLRLALPPTDFAALVAVRKQLHAWLGGAGVGEPALHEILIAVGEACTNALEHSATGRPVSLCAEFRDDAVRIEVVDHGRWRELNPERCRGRGRGRLLMSHLVDEFEMDAGPTGTTVRLTKYLEGIGAQPAAAPAHRDRLRSAAADRGEPADLAG